jgi:hypothetical protein
MLKCLARLPLYAGGAGLMLALLLVMWYGLDAVVLRLHASVPPWMVTEPLTFSQACLPWRVFRHGLVFVHGVAELYVHVRALNHWTLLVPLASATLSTAVLLTMFVLRLTLGWMELITAALAARLTFTPLLEESTRLLGLALTFWIGFPVVPMVLTVQTDTPLLRGATTVLVLAVLGAMLWMIDGLLRSASVILGRAC